MSPIRDYICNDCGFEFESLQMSFNEGYKNVCPHCETDKVSVLPSVTGGYKFANGSGGASITPKGAGSPKRSVDRGSKK